MFFVDFRYCLKKISWQEVHGALDNSANETTKNRSNPDTSQQGLKV